MLNAEGWSLLMILTALFALLAAGYPLMGREKRMAERMRSGGQTADTALGLIVRSIGFVLLGVLPGCLYAGGMPRLLLAVSFCAGIGLMLCVLLPRLRMAHPEALTAAEAVAENRISRMGLGIVQVVSLLFCTAGSLAMFSWVISSVFSLHATLSLGAAALLSLLPAILCGASSRRNMDRVAVIWIMGTVIGMAAVIGVKGTENGSILSGLTEAFGENRQNLPNWTESLSDALWGLGAMGLAGGLQRMLSSESEKSMERAGHLATAAIALLALLCAGIGLLGTGVDATLDTQNSTETILIQIASLESLPLPLSAFLVSGLAMALLLGVQAGMTEIGSIVSWDIALSLTGEVRERPLLRLSAGVTAFSLIPAFVLALDSNRALMNYAIAALLLSAVATAFLWAKAFGMKTCPLGEWIGLGLGALGAVLWILFPQTESLGMIGAVPCMAVVLLSMLLIGTGPTRKETAAEAEDGKKSAEAVLDLPEEETPSAVPGAQSLEETEYHPEEMTKPEKGEEEKTEENPEEEQEDSAEA